MNLLNNIPEEYKKAVFTGYFSIILFSLKLFQDFIVFVKYGTVSRGWGGLLMQAIILASFILLLYSVIKTYKVTDKNVKKHSIYILSLYSILFIIDKGLIVFF